MNNDALVYVHGISQHLPGYSDPWFAAMQRHLNKELDRHEVLWSDIVNPSILGAVMSVMSSSEECIQLSCGIHDVMHDRMMQLACDEGAGPMPMSSMELQEGLASDDFLLYMLNPFIRNQILAEFDSIVRPLLTSGRTLHIISHSWGTVVAYEGLRRLEAISVSGRVENLFTVGSALSISPVQRNLFQRVGDGRRPASVQRWTNLDASWDVVGGRLGNVFGVDAPEHLGMEPVGCGSFLGIVNPRCAHSSYFHEDNITANRDIFAELINE